MRCNAHLRTSLTHEKCSRMACDECESWTHWPRGNGPRTLSTWMPRSRRVDGGGGVEDAAQQEG